MIVKLSSPVSVYSTYLKFETMSPVIRVLTNNILIMQASLSFLQVTIRLSAMKLNCYVSCWRHQPDKDIKIIYKLRENLAPALRVQYMRKCFTYQFQNDGQCNTTL